MTQAEREQCRECVQEVKERARQDVSRGLEVCGQGKSWSNAGAKAEKDILTNMVKNNGEKCNNMMTSALM